MYQENRLSRHLAKKFPERRKRATDPLTKEKFPTVIRLSTHKNRNNFRQTGT